MLVLRKDCGMRLFGRFRNTISNVAQIVLIVLMLPFVAVIIGWISGVGNGGSNMSGILNSLIGNIPLCELWMDILYQYNGGLTAADVASSTVLIIIKALPEALISALCVHVCSETSRKIEARGLPIFSTFIGIFIATIITSLSGLSNNIKMEVLIDLGAVIVMLIGIKIMFKSIFNGSNIFSGKKILLFIIDGLFAVITTAYISGLLMATAGSYTTVEQAVGRIVVLTGVEILSAVIVWAIGRAAKADDIV